MSEDNVTKPDINISEKAQQIENDYTISEQYWLMDQKDRILNELFSYPVSFDRHFSKRFFILVLYNKLTKLGYTDESIYCIIHYRVKEDRIEISDSYLRKCIKDFGNITRYPNKVLYDNTRYVDRNIFNQTYTEYLESEEGSIEIYKKIEVLGRKIAEKNLTN